MTDVHGFHAVSALLEQSPGRIRTLFLLRGRRDERAERIIELARNAQVRVEFVDRRWFDRNAGDAHQGIAANCHELAPAGEGDLESIWESLPSPKLLLVLDGVQDPRNLGACLRSAAAAGVQAVLLPRRRSAPLSAVALKTAAGAAERLRIFEVTNLARRLEWLQAQGVWLVGAMGSAEADWSSVDLTRDIAFILGGEEKGLRPLTVKHCDYLVRIPMAGGMESLNVSVATGVLLFEAVRQRGLGGAS
ncbi:MAG: 23S rRNA (guanosine(2251)-2'-O)-methyltransferase RlmB [Pseudomonadales bacterium]